MRGRAAYLDASAFVKLVVAEPETPALRDALRGWDERSSSALIRTESVRAVRHLGSRAVARVKRQLDLVSLMPIDDRILDAAGLIDPAVVRSLDAIHLASAAALSGHLGVIVTYDRRMIEGAELLGLPVESPT